MPTQNFNIYTGRGYAGELVDSGPRVVQTGVLTSATAGFGVLMDRDASVERGASLSRAYSTTSVYAISHREYNHEASTRPSDGSTSYKEGESVSLIRQGYLYLLVDVGTNALTAGDTLQYVVADGTFTSDADDASTIGSCPNVTAEESVATSATPQLVKCRIDIVA